MAVSPVAVGGIVCPTNYNGRAMRQVAWGMLIGSLAIGIVSLLMFHVLPQVTGARLPLHSERGAWITVHFPSDSPFIDDPHGYIAYLEEELAALAAAVGLSPAELPPRINVFVHNNAGQFRTIIAQRKNPHVRLIFPAAVDLIWGEDPREAFIQLIGDFAVGENRSRLLRHAIIEYVREPGRNHHLPVAAMPEVLRLSVAELLRFEGRFPPTRYQLFNSPHAAAAVVGLAGMARIAGWEYAVDPDLLHMAVSLVAFLSEQPGGLKRVMGLWRVGSLETNLQTVYGVGLTELDEGWREAVALAEQANGWARARGGGLIRVGRLDEAFSLLREAQVATDANDAEAGAIARDLGWIHLLRGEWEAARTSFRQAQQKGESVQHELRLVEVYSQWKTIVVEGARVHVAPDSPLPYDFGERIPIELAEMRRRLASDAIPFPADLVIFVGCPPAKGMTPDLRAGLLVVASPEGLRRHLAELVAFHLWRDQTRSPLLQRGLVRYLSAPDEDHLSLLQNRLHREEWIPLYLLDFSNLPADIVEPLAAGLVDYLLTNHGQESFHTLWRITSPLGGGRSLDTAMSIVYGFTRRELDGQLQRTW